MAGEGGAEPSKEPWPVISQAERTLYEILFYSQGPVGGYILGEGVRELLLKSGLSLTVLSQIWNLADVSHDNVLNVHEFSLVMHLIRGRMAGLVVPQTLPRCLAPPKVQPLVPPPMSQQEKDAYLRVFQALDVKRTGFIDAIVAMALLRSSGLSDDVITSIWDVADFGRDGRLNPDELAIAIHLVRHVKSDGSLEGPVDIFQYAPQHTSPISLLARKRRVAEYQEHKQRLMSLKETRKQQATREAKRLELVKNKIKCLEELGALLHKLGKPEAAEGAQVDQALSQDREEVKKQEEIVFRLKKEHEKVRQETVKIILGEQVFNEDIRVIKADTDELNKRLLTSHSHATKDPDPFHQLYEQRKEKRQGSTIKDLDKIDIYIPFEFSPFDLSVTPDTLPCGARILKEAETKGGEDCDADVLSVIADVKEFGGQFMQDWGGLPTAATTTTTTNSSTPPSSLSSSAATMSSSSSTIVLSSSSSGRKEFDDDEIFMETDEPRDQWPTLDGSNDCLLGLTDDQVVSLKAKLHDLRNELKQLNTDHRKLIFRNPEDYLSRQKAKEVEELSERGRFNRRSATERLRNSKTNSPTLTRREGSGSGSGVRYRVTSDKSPSEAAQAARDYRLKRRSQNLDSASASSSPESSRHASLNQDSLVIKKPNTSPLGSPSVSDDASLSRQSSLSSSDRPVTTSTSLNASQPQPASKSNTIEEEENNRVSSHSNIDTVDTRVKSPPVTTTTSGDSSVLTLRSSRRKDELSLALGATALGRQITVEPTPPPVSGRIKQSEIGSEKPGVNIYPPDKREDNNRDLNNSGLSKTKPNQQSQKIVVHAPSRTSTKKSRAPLPPSPSAVGNSVNVCIADTPILASVSSSVCASTPPKSLLSSNAANDMPIESPTVFRYENTDQTSLNSHSEREAYSPKVPSSDNAQERVTARSPDEESSTPKRPPRIKKHSSSEKRNSGSFNSSVSSTCADSFDKDSITPRQLDQNFAVDSIQPTQDTMSVVTVAKTQAVSNNTPKLQASTKKRPAPSPSPQQITNSSGILHGSIVVENKLPNSTANDKTISTSAESFNPSDNLYKQPPLVTVGTTVGPRNDSKVSTYSTGSLFVDREENDSSPTPPPLPASPPPLPSVRPPLMQEDLNLEEEMVTVEYTAPVNLPVLALSPPSMRTNRQRDVSPSLSPTPTAPGSSAKTQAQRIKSFFDDFNSSSEDGGELISASSSGLGFSSDHHSEVNGEVGGNRVDSSDNDSDLTDSEGEDQKGKYEIFSPGDSGILTSSIATTPEESDAQIELINYTPYNNHDIITNNNYMTTNYNFVNRNINNAANNIATTAPENTNGRVSPLSVSTSSTSSPHSETRSRPSNETEPSTEIMSIANSTPSYSSPVSPPIIEEEFVIKSTKQLPQMSPLKITPRSPHPPTDQSSVANSKAENSKSPQAYNGKNSPTVGSNTTNFDDNEFRSSLPNWSSKSEDRLLSPRSQDIMSKARHFADMVHTKQVIVLKSELPDNSLKTATGASSPKDSESTSLDDVVKQRQDIIKQATAKRKTDSAGAGVTQPKQEQSTQQLPTLLIREDANAEEDDDVKASSSNPSDYGYTYLTPREQPPPEVGWKDREEEVKSGEVSLYSKNVLKDGETTESVDRESIANLSTTKQQWETIFSTNLKSPDDSNPKKKQAPKWEVKLSTSYRGVGANVNVDTGNNTNGILHSGQSDISPPVMEVVSSNNNNDDKEESYHNGVDPGRHESAIEYEIRVAREREDMLRREKEEREKELAQVSSSSLLSSSSSSSTTQKSTTQKSSTPMTVLSSLEVVNGESESYQPAYNELAEADRAHDVWSLDGGVTRTEDKYEIKEVDSNESIIEREIRFQREKEAELEQQRLRLSQELPSSSSSSSISSVQQPQQQHPEGDFVQLAPAIHSPPSGRMSPIQSVTVVHNEAPPSQESVIARELREFQEREEEMVRMRNAVHNNNQKNDSPSNISTQPSPSTQPSSKSMSLNVTADNNNIHKSSLHSPSQITPNSQGTWQREVSPFVSQKRRVSQDSCSSHSMGRASSDTATTPSRSISVQPIADGKESDEDEKPDYFKKQETPFEREIRVAKERENELRRMKGMPELSNKDDYYGSYGASTDNKKDKENDSPQMRHVGYQAPSQQTMKRVSTSRLHQEIQAQKERENSMRSEGKVISDSGELTKTSKYMEVTGSTVGGAEKRNFVTKRSSVSSIPTQAVEVQKNTEVVQKPKESQSLSVQGGSKKALGGGSQNFSYKDFRQTAESKIERELREMREREEELRTQRRASVTQMP